MKLLEDHHPRPDSPSYAYGDSKQANLQGYLQNEIGDRVYFETNKHNINSASAFTLEAQANWLNSTPGFQIIIEGHCDERGTKEYNLALGERRANSVKDFLVSLGVRRVELLQLVMVKNVQLQKEVLLNLGQRIEDLLQL